MKFLDNRSIFIVLVMLVFAMAGTGFSLLGFDGLARLITKRHLTDQASIERGRIGYESYCASCHGKKLEGQPNWKNPLPNGRLPAPPHDASGHTWHHPDDILASIILRGLKPFAGEEYESDMPAFEGVLSVEQVNDILAYIKDRWPERERSYQDQMTDQASNSAPASPAN
jgi:mono/diheme cytochrome c family protein